ncbi:MAG TPA: hypothetical protein VLX91_12925 [Candidatus Acidoferrales bacterium]|nr:hypothetical protein [Candidatus Acidoferrales bacterium]
MPSGSEFVIRVAASLGKKLIFEKWIELLYDVCESRDESRTFEELAFEAKSFRRLMRLLKSGISDREAREKVETEIQNTLKRFSALVESASTDFKESEREQFEIQFFGSASSSFENLTKLLDDFSRIKDFYLMKRDSGERR